MTDVLRSGAARHLGGDLTMSGVAVAVTIEPTSRSGEAAVAVGGAYGLADGGRRRSPRRIRGRPALRTPWGPRASVRGSTSPGFAITTSYADDAFAAGRVAALDQVAWGR